MSPRPGRPPGGGLLLLPPFLAPLLSSPRSFPRSSPAPSCFGPGPALALAFLLPPPSLLPAAGPTAPADCAASGIGPVGAFWPRPQPLVGHTGAVWARGGTSTPVADSYTGRGPPDRPGRVVPPAGPAGPLSPGGRQRAEVEGLRADARHGMPSCEMFLDAESLNHVSGTSVLGWRAGGTLLGRIADNDVGRRVLLVIDTGDSFLITGLVAHRGPGAGERPPSWRLGR